MTVEILVEGKQQLGVQVPGWVTVWYVFFLLHQWRSSMDHFQSCKEIMNSGQA